MKRVFETAECEEVRNSIFWEPRYKKHENQMKVVAWNWEWVTCRWTRGPGGFMIDTMTMCGLKTY